MLVIFFHRATTLGHYDLFDDFEDGSDYNDMKSDDMGDYYGDTDFDYDYEGDAKRKTMTSFMTTTIMMSTIQTLMTWAIR